MNNIIEETIKNHISEKNAVFVFPTQISADLWADRTCLVTEYSAVPMEKFIPWDVFKGNAVRSENQNKDPIPAIMRLVFGEKIVAENAENPFLKNLIIPEYAKTAASFASWISSLLPQLGLWKEYSDKNGGISDDEDEDLNLIYKKYSDFMEKHNLFDPAWEKPPFKNNGNHYYLFFPEILEDWEEYKTILESSKTFITIIKVEDRKIESPVNIFNNSRIEIKNVASYVSNLKRQKNVKWDEIAVSVPNMDVYAPYIEKEFDLMEIPYVSKYSKPLGQSGAGNLFSQIKNCIEQDFSFDSIKNLLLDNELPWKENSLKEQLIKFGQENHCVCNFDFKNVKIDVWEKSFKQQSTEELLETYYKKLKKSLTKFKKTVNFNQIRQSYFEFINEFFDMENCSEKSDKILGRCISELGGMIDLENRFDECVVSEPFSFFVNYLSSKPYLEQLEQGGVAILPFKTVATAPFKIHILFDSSQKSLSVIYRKFSFLNDEKRLRLLKNEEINVSEKFIQLYENNSLEFLAYFTCGIKTFDGYSQACSYLVEKDLTKETNENILFPNNPYNSEKKWFIGDSSKDEFPSKIMKFEQKSFENWMKIQNVDEKNSKKAEEFVLNFGKNENLNKVYVSTSQLSIFYDCPRKWFFQNKLQLSETDNAAELINSYAIGEFYHKILELYLKNLKETNQIIEYSENGYLNEYQKKLIQECINDAVSENNPATKYNSYLAKEILNTSKVAVEELIENCLIEFYRIFNNCRVYDVEGKLFEENEKFNLVGRYDCLLKDCENQQFYLIDFKTSENAIPKKIYAEENEEENSEKNQENPLVEEENRVPLEEQDLPNFQMPTYIHLLQNQKSPIKVENAAFFSIKDFSCKAVIGKNMQERIGKKTKKQTKNFDEFQETIKKTLECIDNFVLRVNEGDFAVNSKVQNYKKCAACSFKSICRKTFNVGKK